MALDVEFLKALFDYSATTGVIKHKPRNPNMFDDGFHSAEVQARRWNTRYANREAFTSLDTHGYRQSHVQGSLLRGHRVAWALHHGKWPSGQIDHVNGDRADNRIENLRDVSLWENAKNRSLQSNSSAEVMGVYWAPELNKWRARIGVGGKCKHLGVFVSKCDAVEARKYAERKYGYHTNHGRAA